MLMPDSAPGPDQEQDAGGQECSRRRQAKHGSVLEALKPILHLPPQLGVISGVIRNEGILTLYNGLSAGLLRQATYTTARFVTLHCCAVQYSSLYNAVQYSTVLCTMQCVVVQLSVQCSAVQCSAVPCSAVQFSVRYSAVQCICQGWVSTPTCLRNSLTRTNHPASP